MLTLLKSWVRPDAFQTVLNERGPRWYNACLRITRDADLAADAVQEALLKAWDRRNEFRGDAALDSWIHRIALNAAIEAARAGDLFKEEAEAAVLGMKTPEEAMASLVKRVQPLLPA